MTDESTCMDFPHHIKGKVFVCSRMQMWLISFPHPNPCGLKGYDSKGYEAWNQWQTSLEPISSNTHPNRCKQNKQHMDVRSKTRKGRDDPKLIL